MKNSVKIMCTLVIVAVMVIPVSVLAQHPQPASMVKQSKETYDPEIKHMVYAPLASADFDPLDSTINVTVSINEIRALKTIDLFSDPDFYVKVTINNNTFESPVWQNTKNVEDPNWSATTEVPKDEEFVNVSIELWDKNSGNDMLCDISPDDGTYKQCRTVEMTYSIATGIWIGWDDYLGDLSGYGRLSGIDDNSIDQQDRDCELWFNITQTDYDHDGLPYWVEVNMYNTSPLVNNLGEDLDHDGVPIEWEHFFGLYYIEWGHEQGYYMEYDPNFWENQTALDPDNDGLNNIEEYKTWQWGSDPFRQDIFIEIDQMAAGPKGETGFAPTAAFDLLRDAYAKHSIVWHIDDGRLGGGEQVPFDDNMSQNDLANYYWLYFMHGDAQNWRRGIFRWCIVGYNGAYAWHGTLVNGFTFSSDINHSSALDCFFVSSKNLNNKTKEFPLIGMLIRGTLNRDTNLAIIWAGAIMHETGHTLACSAPGCDCNGVMPWQINFWRYANYKSVMNYRYIYTSLLDYSDGSHGKNDYDDWNSMDLTYFNPRGHFQP